MKKFTVICRLPPFFVHVSRAPMIGGLRKENAGYAWQKSQRLILRLSRALPRIPQKLAEGPKIAQKSAIPLVIIFKKRATLH